MNPHGWQKSSYCQEGDACLHISAAAPDAIHLTESADPAETILTAAPLAFSSLLDMLRSSAGQ
jgi:hypothetical protein